MHKGWRAAIEPADRGIFLPETWRLPPAICSYRGGGPRRLTPSAIGRRKLPPNHVRDARKVGGRAYSRPESAKLPSAMIHGRNHGQLSAQEQYTLTLWFVRRQRECGLQRFIQLFLFCLAQLTYVIRQP